MWLVIFFSDEKFIILMILMKLLKFVIKFFLFYMVKILLGLSILSLRKKFHWCFGAEGILVVLDWLILKKLVIFFYTTNTLLKTVNCVYFFKK